MQPIGYIYIWYDTVLQWFYVGGHKGTVKDSYICSSKTMKRAYLKRPKTFRFRVLEWVYDADELRSTEQRWLDQIKQSELLTTANIRDGSVRYYNVKLTSAGGNGVGTNKGDSRIGGHNRQSWRIHSPDGEIVVDRSYAFAKSLGRRWSNLFVPYLRNRPTQRGEWAGWYIIGPA